jgi:DNA-binding NarL/FixJ family response regulator
MSPRLPLLLAVFPAYQAWDLYQLVNGGATYHLVTEAAATIAFLAVLYLLVRDRRRAAREFEALRYSADASARASRERDESAQQSTRTFLRSMQDQFDAWKLTPSEKDVALLLVKGLSLEEIARVRESGAKTVRQHAANVYAKAKLEGRHQLAAYFLEDLMTPAVAK